MKKKPQQWKTINTINRLFTNRIVEDLNKLSQETIDWNNLNLFKNYFDKFKFTEKTAVKF
jgi:hypothetical protein